MPNPFVYGEIVPSSAFADRVEELEQLTTDLQHAQKVFLISPRRYGKSSLIRRAIASLERRGILPIEITVANYSSYLAFLEGYARAVASVQTPWDRARAWLRDALGTNAPEVRLERDVPGGRLTVAFPGAATAREVERLAPDVFALPARLAQARGHNVVVALDEFQAIGAFDGGTVEQALRAAIQTQRDVGYVFAGSEPSLMERMLGPKRPFYKAGPVMRLGRIPPDEFAAFIESRFSRSGIKPEPGLGNAIVDLAGNMPYDVQRLAHEAWDDVKADGRKRVTEEDLHHTLKRLLAQNETIFEKLWQRLTIVQRATLRAVVLTDGRALLSNDVRSRYRLGGTSTVQAALAALTREDLVMREEDKYLVNDSLFREWIARKTF
jgi:hypothetical protein